MADSRTAAGNIVDEPGASCRNYKEVLWLKQTMIGVLTDKKKWGERFKSPLQNYK